MGEFEAYKVTLNNNFARANQSMIFTQDKVR